MAGRGGGGSGQENLLYLTRPQSSLMRKLQDAKDDGKEGGEETIR